MTKKQSTIQVVVKNPGARPELRTIANDLATFKSLVGGYIESPSLPDGTEFIVNEEGKLDGLPVNFYAPAIQDVIVGPAVFVKADYNSGEYVSLSEAECQAIVARFDKDHWLISPQLGLVPIFE